MALQKQTGKTVHSLINDDGTFPNNGRLPLLAYQGVLELPAGDPETVRTMFGNSTLNLLETASRNARRTATQRSPRLTNPFSYSDDSSSSNLPMIGVM